MDLRRLSDSQSKEFCHTHHLTMQQSSRPRLSGVTFALPTLANCLRASHNLIFCSSVNQRRRKRLKNVYQLQRLFQAHFKFPATSQLDFVPFCAFPFRSGSLALKFRSSACSSPPRLVLFFTSLSYSIFLAFHPIWSILPQFCSIFLLSPRSASLKAVPRPPAYRL